MTIFLFNLSSRFDATFVIISDSPQASIWLSREIAMQCSSDNCYNIYPVFLNYTDIPDWWLGNDNHFINLDSASQDTLDAFLNLA